LIASPSTHPDLYWALRGSGNNFGIVTSFNLLTKPLPNDLLWGGTRSFTSDAFPTVVKTWIDLTFHSSQDPKAGSWIAFLNTGGLNIAAVELWYGAPNGREAAILAPWWNITAVADNTKTRGHAEYVVANEASIVYGLREIYYDISVQASYIIAQRSIDIFYAAITALDGVENAYPVLIWQHITAGSLKASTRNGGNAMSLDPEGGPLHVVQLACSWSNAADDDKVYKVMSDIMRTIKEESVALGVQSDWVYMNYASQFQDVIGSYGPSKSKLQSIAKKYDPKGVYQTLQPGYFKLDRAPIVDARYFSH
jgi:hypothetical protein